MTSQKGQGRGRPKKYRSQAEARKAQVESNRRYREKLKREGRPLHSAQRVQLTVGALAMLDTFRRESSRQQALEEVIGMYGSRWCKRHGVLPLTKPAGGKKNMDVELEHAKWGDDETL